MQYNYNPNAQHRDNPQGAPGVPIYPAQQPPGPRFYDWHCESPVYGNSLDCYPRVDFQRPPPCQTYSGTRFQGVPHPVHYPNFNVLPCGDYPHPQFDRDYRLSSCPNVEQSCMEQQNLFNSDQGTYFSQSHNEVFSGSQQRIGFHVDNVRPSWEPQNGYTSTPQNQDWRSSYRGLEPQIPSSWTDDGSNYGYVTRQGNRCQSSRERCLNQPQYRERSRSPPSGGGLNNNPQFYRHTGNKEPSLPSHYNNPTYPNPSSLPPQRPLFAVVQNTSFHRIASESLLVNPGRKSRPPKILIILRGLPGSGKSTLAKLIKEKEAKAAEDEGKSAAVRILSMDDFFANDEGKFVYEPEMEGVYREQLVKLLARQMDNGLFNFILVDAINRSAAELEELAVQARTRQFQVYVIEVNTSLSLCLNRSAGRRLESDIRAIHANWEPTPSRYTIVDANSLQQEIMAEEVEMEADSEDEADTLPRPCPPPSNPASGVDGDDSTANGKGKGDKKDNDEEEEEAEEDTSRDAWGLTKSKWDDDASFQRLERLDGIKRKIHHSHSSNALSMAEYLKDEASQFRKRKEGVKRVTWADIEALRENSRIRELGFVVGQTDWSRMTKDNDEKIASQALTRTKYF